MIGFIFAVLVFSLLMIILSGFYRNFFCAKFDRFLENGIFFWIVFSLCLFLTIISIPLLFRSPESFGIRAALFVRFRPIIQLFSLLSLETLVAFFLIRLEFFSSLFHKIQHGRMAHPPLKHIFRQVTIKPSYLLGITLGLGLVLIIAIILWLPYHQIGYWLFLKHTWLGWGCIVCGVVLFFIGSFYNRFIFRLLSALAFLAMAWGITSNIKQFNHINWHSAPGIPIEQLRSNNLFDLFYRNRNYQVARYSLFAIIAEKYPGYSLTMDETLFNNQEFEMDTFYRFGRLNAMEVVDLEELTENQTEYLLSMCQINYEFYIKENILFHLISPNSATFQNKTITLRMANESEVFIYPSQMEQLLP